MKSNKKPKILILSAASGYGHISAGFELSKRLAERITTWDVEHQNLCTYANPAERWIIEKGWELFSTIPVLRNIYSFLHKQFLSSDYFAHTFKFLYKRIAGDLLKQIKENDVQCVIALHPSAVCASSLIKHKKDFLFSVVATDLLVHSIQSLPEVDRIFADKNAHFTSPRSHKIKQSEKFIDSGLPIARRFFRNKLMDSNSSIEHSKLKVLVSFGAKSIRLKNSLKLIDHALESLPFLEITFACGTNRKIIKHLKERYRSDKFSERVIIKGFVKNFEQYLHNCDAIIGKAGGMSVGEALASKIPMVFLDKLPGQEEHNIAVALKLGEAYNCNNTKEIIQILHQLFKEKSDLSEQSNLLELEPYERGIERIVSELELALTANEKKLDKVA